MYTSDPSLQWPVALAFPLNVRSSGDVIASKGRGGKVIVDGWSRF